MFSPKTSTLAALAAFLTVLSCAALTIEVQAQSGETVVQNKEKPVSESVARVAGRLQTRLKKRGLPSPSISVLEHAVDQRRELLKLSVPIVWQFPDGSTREWRASPGLFPGWIVFESSMTSAGFHLDADRILTTFESGELPELTRAVSPHIVQVVQDGQVMRASLDQEPVDGWKFDVQDTARKIFDALGKSKFPVVVPLTLEKATMNDGSGSTVGTLTHLATGRSNFTSASYERTLNVRKALGEKVQDVLIPPGTVFSFNAVLGGAITSANGWHMAKVIFEGDQVRDAPGGGICQASTTVFRALVQIGLPILQRKNHSLYVSYYEKHGVGMDATVFPYIQDLKLLNDTPGYLLLHVGMEGYEAKVDVYGVDDGRTVKLEGPYFGVNAPKSLTVHGRPVRNTEIVWLSHIQDVSGNERTDEIVSPYKSIPKSIIKKYVASGASLD